MIDIEANDIYNTIHTFSRIPLSTRHRPLKKQENRALDARISIKYDDVAARAAISFRAQQQFTVGTNICQQNELTITISRLNSHLLCNAMLIIINPLHPRNY